MIFSIALASVLLTAASAAPARQNIYARRALILADGNGVHQGALPDWDFTYYAAGYLAKGNCPSSAKISKCYKYTLSDDPTKNLDPVASAGGNDIQSVIMNGPSYIANGSIMKFNFKLQVDSVLNFTSPDSFPLVEIVSQEPDGTPSTAVYLDVRDNQAGIFSFTDTATPSVSIPLKQFIGITTLQTWIVKSGPGGYADITIVEAATKRNLLKYKSVGQNSRVNYHMRVGTDRSTVDIRPLKVYWGDWSATSA